MRLFKNTTDEHGWTRIVNSMSPPSFSIGGLKMLRFPISLGGRVSEAKGWNFGNDRIAANIMKADNTDSPNVTIRQSQREGISTT